MFQRKRLVPNQLCPNYIGQYLIMDAMKQEQRHECNENLCLDSESIMSAATWFTRKLQLVFQCQT